MKRFVAAAAALSFTFLAIPHANAVGSLAIDKNHGSHYGWAVNQPDEDTADQEALSHCTGECTVVMHFEHTCVAYAADQAEDSTVYGWSMGSDADDAKDKAIEKCSGQGGNSCVVRVWGCDK